MYLYMIIAIVTIIEFVMMARMDIKERKIYTFPMIMLSIAWLSYLFSTEEYAWQFLVCYTLFNLSSKFLFNRMKIWGAGDSDAFLVLSNVLLAVTGPVSGWMILFLECIAIMGVMAAAIVIGFVESKIKKEKLNLKSKVAVVPGFAVVITVLLIIGVVGRIL